MKMPISLRPLARRMPEFDLHVVPQKGDEMGVIPHDERRLAGVVFTNLAPSLAPTGRRSLPGNGNGFRLVVQCRGAIEGGILK
jgi:hypothetical protein